MNEPKYIIICNKFCACIYHVFILRNVHIAKSKRKPKIKYLFGKLFMHPNSFILFFQLCIVKRLSSHNIHIKPKIKRMNWLYIFEEILWYMKSIDHTKIYEHINEEWTIQECVFMPSILFDTYYCLVKTIFCYGIAVMFVAASELEYKLHVKLLWKISW